MSSAVPSRLQKGPGFMSSGADKHMVVPKEQRATLRKKIHTRPPQVRLPCKARVGNSRMSYR